MHKPLYTSNDRFQPTLEERTELVVFTSYTFGSNIGTRSLTLPVLAVCRAGSDRAHEIPRDGFHLHRLRLRPS